MARLSDQGAEQSAQSRKSIVLRLLTAIADKDRPAASACLAEDVTWWVPQSAAGTGLERPIRGRQPVLDLLCGRSRYQPGSMVWQQHHVVHDRDMVVAHCTLRAKTSSGKPYENQYALIYRFEGDRIAESWEHTDTAYAFSRFSDESSGTGNLTAR